MWTTGMRNRSQTKCTKWSIATGTLYQEDLYKYYILKCFKCYGFVLTSQIIVNHRVQDLAELNIVLVSQLVVQQLLKNNALGILYVPSSNFVHKMLGQEVRDEDNWYQEEDADHAPWFRCALLVELQRER